MSHESPTTAPPQKQSVDGPLPVSVSGTPDGEFVVIEAEGYPAIGLPNVEAFVLGKMLAEQIQRNLDLKKGKKSVS
jgi:hypothetical protein